MAKDFSRDNDPRPRRSGPHRPQADAVGATLVGALGLDHGVGQLLDRAFEEWLATGESRPLARAMVATMTAAGAEGAELWARNHRGGWRRLAADGDAVPCAAEAATGSASGYPGRTLVVQGTDLAIVASADHPGTDLRGTCEDLAEMLLALADSLGWALDEDGPAGLAA